MNKKFYIYSFYRFVELKNIEKLKFKLEQFLSGKIVRGTVLLSKEGINGSISASRDDLSMIFKFMKNDLLNIRKFNMKINETDFLPFNKMKVKLKKEIVSLGKGDIDVIKYKAKSVNPNDWDNLILDKNTKLIDVRNQFEIDIGKFQNSLNPKTNNFREFPDSVCKLKINKNDKIAIYCTGGIRCEKASAYLKLNGYKNIFQLNGGIINYLEYKKRSNKNKLWEGECFVFDDRVSINARLNKGKYLQCFGCRRAITKKDTRSADYKKGVSCPYCYNKRTIEQIRRSQTRQDQINRAKILNIPHSFKKIY